MSHKCHAVNCSASVSPSLLMCLRHWHMVPKAIQDRVWQAYRAGQEVTKTPSLHYLSAATDAIRAVAEEEQATERGQG